MSIFQKMNERYVDEINMPIQAAPGGSRNKNGQILKDETAVEEDERISEDERTMTLVKHIGDDIHPSIKLEVDYPSKHQERK